MADILHLVRHNEMPPGGFSYTVPETGVTLPPGRTPFTCFTDLFKAVQAHYHANRLSPPADLKQKLEDHVCRRLPPGWCENQSGAAYMKTAGLASWSIAAVKQATATMLSWFREGFEMPEMSVIEKRVDTCLGCPMHGYPGDCSACAANQLASMVGAVAIGSRFPKEVNLATCRVCGCSLRIKTRIPVDVIRKHMPEEQIDALPSHCWVKTEP